MRYTIPDDLLIIMRRQRLVLVLYMLRLKWRCSRRRWMRGWQQLYISTRSVLRVRRRKRRMLVVVVV